MKKSIRIILWLIFIAYCGLMLHLLFSRTAGEIRSYNIVPFRTIKEFWLVMRQSFGVEYAESLFMASLVNLAGNIVMFIPLGLLPPLLGKKPGIGWRCPVAAAAAIVAVELVQYLTGLGSADIDDFILNMLGAALGWLIFALGRKILGRVAHDVPSAVDS